MASKSAQFWFGEIDCAEPCSSFVALPAVLIARMSRADLMVTFDPLIELYFLKSRHTATIAYSVGVSASAVIQLLHDGLISAAGSELPLTYLLTSKGRQAGDNLVDARNGAHAPRALHDWQVLEARLLAAEARFRRGEDCVARMRRGKPSAARVQK